MRQSAIAAHLLKSCKTDQRVSRAIVAHQPVYLRSFGLLVLLDANLVSYSCLRFLKALLYCCWKPDIWAYFASRMLPKCLYYTFIPSLTDCFPANLQRQAASQMRQLMLQDLEPHGNWTELL